MLKQKPLTDAKGEVRELAKDFLKTFRPTRAALPESLRRKVGVRGPQKSLTKERITIRLSREVLQRFRATRRGVAYTRGCGAKRVAKEA